MTEIDSWEDSFESDSKNMNFIQKLISAVSSRPLLWDRFDNDYHNRTAMDQEWDRIAKMLGKDKDFVKQKWRNLRDQFQRESKKVKVPFDNPTKPYIQYYRGKWIYFEHMLFLKDGALKRTSTCYSPPQEIEIREDDIKEEIIDFDDDIFAQQINNYNNDSDNYEKEPSINSPSEETQSTIQPKFEIIEDNSENDQLDEIRLKRKVSETGSEHAIPAKSRRPSVAEASTNTEDQVEEIDDDLHFVKSLVPYLRKLSPIRKLLVRNEIQSLLIRESLCEKCKMGKSSLHNSS